MMPFPHRDAVALSARTLGALFSYAPNNAQIAPLVAAFQDGSWQQQWPYPVAAPLASGFAASAEESLPEAWQRLFIGPWALPAPPWGSVWLDKESVLFGESTLALREWMRANGIALDADRNEPEDHFGTLRLNLGSRWPTLSRPGGEPDVLRRAHWRRAGGGAGADPARRR